LVTGCAALVHGGWRVVEREPSEQDLVCRAFGIDEVLAMVQDGTVKDALSIAAIGLLRLKGLL
jgi:ADP-ribose pyrophosphatase